jgi:hypothetical protein
VRQLSELFACGIKEKYKKMFSKTTKIDEKKKVEVKGSVGV